MKDMKYVNKIAKRCIDAIKINIEHRLNRVYELQLEYLSGRWSNPPEVYAEKTKDELTCITESMLCLGDIFQVLIVTRRKIVVQLLNLVLTTRIILLQPILKIGHILGNHFHR